MTGHAAGRGKGKRHHCHRQGGHLQRGGGGLGPGTWDPSLLALVVPTMWWWRRFPSPLIGATMRGAISAPLEAISVGDL